MVFLAAAPQPLVQHMHVHFGIEVIHMRVMKREAFQVQSPFFSPLLSSSSSMFLQDLGAPGKTIKGTDELDPLLGTRPIQCSAFQPSVQTAALVSLTVTDVGLVMQSTPSGVIELRAGLGGLELNDECNISPLPIASLFTHVSSFAGRLKKEKKSKSRISKVMKYTHGEHLSMERRTKKNEVNLL